MRTPVPSLQLQAQQRPRVLSLIEQYGLNSTSFQVLEEGFTYWFSVEPAACIAYFDTGSAFVVAGAPVAERRYWPELIKRFESFAAEQRRRICFFAVEQGFVEPGHLAALRVGEQPVWIPADWVANMPRSVRQQVRRATKQGVEVTPQPAIQLGSGSPMRLACEALIGRWQAQKAMQPMQFLVRVEPFSHGDHRRYFVAQRPHRTTGAPEVVGFLAIVPVYARQGWFFEDLISTGDAPNGTAESLIDAAMRQVHSEGATYVTLGLAPLAGSVNFWLRAARRFGRGLYNFVGLHRFKARLHPNFWEPIYLAYPARQGAVRSLLDVLRAFAPAGLLRFGLHTLWRGPAVVVKILAYLLVPWTLMLALMDTHAWFPAPWVHWAWVSFDAALFCGLTQLNRSWNRRLAQGLIGLISLDTIVTLSEALLYPGPAGRTTVLIKGIAVAAPALAAWVLMAAYRHRLRWQV
jgi:phosphatidylglycerol lysyltransferase